MKLEYLILLKDNDSFCKNKKSFIDLLEIDNTLSINRTKLVFKQPRKKEISVKFKVETDVISSNQERFFLIVLENNDESLVDEFSELGIKIQEIAKRINSELTINTLWDDVGRYYAELAYPLINEVENLMRKLISKFMLINVGMKWSKETLHPEILTKIENYKDEDLHLNDLYKLDFIQLSNVLFQKKRDIEIETLTRLLSKTTFSEEDQKEIKKYIPKSNWEKYFDKIVDVKSKDLEDKWELLYKLRNKVAHNRFIDKNTYQKIEGLCKNTKSILTNAINKLGEINLDEEDIELIMHSYQSESLQFQGQLAEKAVAIYYSNKGYKIEIPTLQYQRYQTDFIAFLENKAIAIEVKFLSHKKFFNFFGVLKQTIIRVKEVVNSNNYTKGEIVIVLRDYSDTINLLRIKEKLSFWEKQNELENIKIIFGFLNEEKEFEPREL